MALILDAITSLVGSRVCIGITAQALGRGEARGFFENMSYPVITVS